MDELDAGFVPRHSGDCLAFFARVEYSTNFFYFVFDTVRDESELSTVNIVLIGAILDDLRGLFNQDGPT